ncbi:MAG: CBS domain-containing protein [Anaerolineae bacterium]|nr:CBS domain-containing protein [Anaerolineae bacterium]
MFVRHRMSSPAVTVGPNVPVMEALQIMKEQNVRRLVVVDNRGRLAGIVSEKDVLRASPSQATTLSIYEVSYLLQRLTVSEIMARDVVTVIEDTPLEEAARLMAERHLGGLPVMRGQQVVGIITETDILMGFSEALGAFAAGVRVMVDLPDEPGAVASVVDIVKDLGGNIASLSLLRPHDPGRGYLVARIQGISAEELEAHLRQGPGKVLDVRVMPG